MGIDEASIDKFEVELEQEDGVMVYEVDIDTDSTEYEVLIDAKEGSVYVEVDNDEDDEEDDVFPTEVLTEQEVLDLVATELQLDVTLFTEVEFDQEMDNGLAFYEVSLMVEGTEYELEVDAVTGVFYTISMDEDGFDDNDEMEDIEED